MEIYDSDKRSNPFLDELIAIWKYRELVFQNVSRSIKTRYKRSFLGVIWSLLNPLLTMLVITVVFSQIFRFQVEYYPVYLLTGLIAWNFFSSSTLLCMSEMLSSAPLLQRIYVPKGIFVLSAVGTGIINLLLSIIPLILILFILKVPIRLSILALPLSIVILGIFALGVGFILSSLVMFFTDLVPIVEVLLVIMMYGTPIFYPIAIIPSQWLWLMQLNPMKHMLDLFRVPILMGRFPDPGEYLITIVFAVVTLIIGWTIFTSRINEYAYRA
jgi:ABC-type polysaccharide/polyol phosphate export permease